VNFRTAAWLAALTVTLSFGWFAVDGHVGINLADEGYLWYGTRALNAGQVPIRDFQAYDPGRYVWTAAWSHVLGDGLVSMRAACVIFHCFGIFAGLLTAARVSRDWRFLVLVAITLTLWMTPRFKVFEQSIALMAIWVAVRLLEQPTTRRHFLSGVFVGLMAFIGRNHGLYLTVAFALVMLAMARGEWAKLPRGVLAWSGGVLLGYTPQWLMFAFVPGYFDAFLALLQRNVTLGSNLAMAVPWPWRIPAEYSGPYWRNAFVEGCFFLALPLFVIAAFTRILMLGKAKLSQHRPLLAAACVALPYAHHTFSRADSIHLAHSAPALVLGLIALVASICPRTGFAPHSVALVLCMATVSATIRHSGLFHERMDARGTFVTRDVLGQSMRVSRESAAILDTATKLSEDHARPDEAVMFLPHWPGLYAATSRWSPLPQIYFIRPASAAEEERTVAQMETRRVAWVMLQDYRLDGRDALRFRRTNPMTFEYLARNFEQIAVPGSPSDTTVWRRRRL